MNDILKRNVVIAALLLQRTIILGSAVLLLWCTYSILFVDWHSFVIASAADPKLETLVGSMTFEFRGFVFLYTYFSFVHNALWGFFK